MWLLQFTRKLMAVTMPRIHINVKNDFINVISNLGHEIEVDQDTLARWNEAIAHWWKVQLEMDSFIARQKANG